MNWLLFFVFSMTSPVLADLPKTAQEVTRMQLLQSTEGLTPGEKSFFALRISLQDHWHTYWENPGDSGAGPKLQIKSSVSLQYGPLLLPPPQRIETKSLISFAFENEVTFPFEIQLPANAPSPGKIDLEIRAEWLVCDEICIPAIETRKLSLPVQTEMRIRKADADLIERSLGLIPAVVSPAGKIEGDQVRLEWPNPLQNFRPVDFFPAADSGLSVKKPILRTLKNGVQFDFKKADYFDGTPAARGLLIFENAKAERRGLYWGSPPEPRAAELLPAQRSALAMFAFAFLGGLLLNLMPCVFPILSLKLLTLVKQSEQESRRIRLENLAYTAGVLLSFLILGLSLGALRAAGEKLGWGFQLQSPLFLAFLIFLFFLLSLNFLGVFEIDFLNPNFGESLTRKRDFAGSFFTGVFAVLVASPCTAPFMGAALGFALSEKTPALIAIFLCLGLGLAFPYLLFAVAPGLARLLPRPGSWMKTLKEFMAFPLLATAVWLAWVLANLAGTETLAIVLAALVGLGLAVWWPKKSVGWILGALIFAGGLLLVAQAGSAPATKDAKSAENSGPWSAFDPALLKTKRASPIFLDVTADWCLSCKVNERLVLSTPETQKLFRDAGVTLMKADWTKRDPAITDLLGEYERAGVPLYLLFPKGDGRAVVLPEVLTFDLIQQEILKLQGGVQK